MLRSRRREALVCGALIIFIFAVYWPVLHLGFITYDDPEYVTSNASVRAGLTLSSVTSAFTRTSSAEWHPLTMISHMADCQLYGLNPTGHHLTNLVFHAANSLLLLFLLLELTDTFWLAALVTFVFALHPVNVETVAWISERKGLLSTFFGLSCLLAYARYAKACRLRSVDRSSSSDAVPRPPAASPGTKVTRTSPERPRFYYGLSLVLLALGLLSKPMLVTWPFLMLLIDFWPLRRINLDQPGTGIRGIASLLKEKLPFFALVLASSVATFFVARSWGAVTAGVQTPFSTRLTNSVLAYALYLAKLFWPAKLSINYPFELRVPPLHLLLASVSLALITGLVLAYWKRRAFLLVGWAWFLGTLVPVIGLLHFGNHFMADRYSYFTAIGIFIMVVWTAASFATTKPAGGLLGLGAILILGACGLVARHQLGYWHNSETLFKHALAVDSKDFVAWNNLGFFYETRGERASAERCYRAALAISPGSTFALGKLAALLIDEGGTTEAVQACELALSLNPDMPDVHCTLGLAFMKEGKRDAAFSEYIKALQLRPDFAPAHYNLANALAAAGQFDEAIQHYRESLRWDPDSSDAHNNLAYLLMRTGQLGEAEAQFRSALKIRADMWQADYGLAEVLTRSGNVEAAQKYYRAALQTKPDFQEAIIRLAWSLATTSDPRLRDGKQAVALAEKACTLTSYKQPSSLHVLAAAYAEAGDYSKASECAQKAQSIASAAGQADFARNLQHLLDLFAAGKPYHEPKLPGQK